MAIRRAVIQVLVIKCMLLIANAAIEVPTAKPGCQDRCGNVSIPYPFGTIENCYYDPEFLITCDETFDPPQAFLTGSPINVTNITLQGKMHVLQFVASDCYNASGAGVYNNVPSLQLSKFVISYSDNKFVTVGCDTEATIQGRQGREGYMSTGCSTKCDSIDSISNGSCSGIGCCQVSLPESVSNFNVTASSFNNHRGVWNFSPCSYGFVVEEDQFNFTSNLLQDLQNGQKLPMVLDWTIGNESCKILQEKMMPSECEGNSACYDPDNGSTGYRCKCFDGFDGNPYLSNDCQDIDECEDQTLNDCERICTNTVGNYTCSCPKGYHGDGRKAGNGCTMNRSLVIPIAVGISVGVTALLICITWLYWGIQRWKFIKLREKFFKQNGGLMLQQQISGLEGSATDFAKIFTAEELEKATNNYDEKRIVGRGGYGTVYKGILTDGRLVAIKKSKFMDENQIEPFINEVIVLSQINHRNVVKLLGCCLETQVPLLVYEYIANDTLSGHLNSKTKTSRLPWEIRLRIAAETAGVLSYLHYAASVPIIHRDVKSTNILLDDTYTAKVSDFGASRLVPLDQTELSTMVQGTFGYLDPEYLHTSQLTEKSDVYSFGVVLVELLTGQEALSFQRPEEQRNLAMYFISALKGDRLLEVMEDCVVNECDTQKLKEVAELARRCLKVKGEERPTMKEVAMELEGLRIASRHTWANSDGTELQETEHLLGDDRSDGLSFCYGTNGSTSMGYDSVKNHVLLPVHGGR
ncbi:putative wall-associated receptor kinase-like 16 [Tripterygium wilfordii]|uniref:putative wall-associated receptor kinase-like 16 n=1 Tax=Tripterygium wilfordii TaxID=458696 RepID=UPI0018F819F1|nr:putative wall-associated receptor kinase-like 16 [Tripterygium wilfordii]